MDVGSLLPGLRSEGQGNGRLNEKISEKIIRNIFKEINNCLFMQTGNWEHIVWATFLPLVSSPFNFW